MKRQSLLETPAFYVLQDAKIESAKGEFAALPYLGRDISSPRRTQVYFAPPANRPLRTGYKQTNTAHTHRLRPQESRSTGIREHPLPPSRPSAESVSSRATQLIPDIYIKHTQDHQPPLPVLAVDHQTQCQPRSNRRCGCGALQIEPQFGRTPGRRRRRASTRNSDARIRRCHNDRQVDRLRGAARCQAPAAADFERVREHGRGVGPSD